MNYHFTAAEVSTLIHLATLNKHECIHQQKEYWNKEDDEGILSAFDYLCLEVVKETLSRREQEERDNEDKHNEFIAQLPKDVQDAIELHQKQKREATMERYRINNPKLYQVFLLAQKRKERGE